MSAKFQEEIEEASRALMRRLDRHRNRYINAWCLRYGVPYDELGDCELVMQTKHDGLTVEQTFFMRRSR